MNKKLLIVIICLWALAACGGREETPPTLIAPPATAVTQNTEPTTEATATTAVLPAATNTLPPPPTLAPPPATPTPIQTPTPAAPESLLLLKPEDFTPDRNPLTGEILDDSSVLERRPLAIKISNAPAFYVRPQSGLNSADWVFEHTAEGAVTRFTLLLYSQSPETVGPIRSARLIDLELPAMYDAALVYSGTSAGVGNRMLQSDIAGDLVRSNEPGYYRTGDQSKPFEHTLYARPDQIWAGLEAGGRNHPPDFQTQVAFGSEPPANGRPANYASVNYRSTFVEWTYDPTTNRYLRRADNEDIIDALDGEQVSAANVVIIAPFHVEDPTICEQINDGVCTALTVQIQIWGSGQGVVLRDGQVYDVTWHRDGRHDMLTFTDANGDPFPLQIGNTWVQLVPTWLRDPVEITE
ncbi:MAG TPA: DUF3048 domain-containing protein [Chloroflexota bacterium]|nr:DUF3048 domain-containing protein [Chloroflexota bacterium]